MVLFDLSYLQSLGINQLLFSLLLPFFVLFAIFWGLLVAMKIFGNKVNTILALIFALVILPTPAFVWFATYLVQLGTTIALAAFILIFIFGVIRWALFKGYDIYSETGGYDRKIKKLLKKREKLAKERAHSKPERQRRIDQEIADIDREIKGIEAERATLGY